MIKTNIIVRGLKQTVLTEGQSETVGQAERVRQVLQKVLELNKGRPPALESCPLLGSELNTPTQSNKRATHRLANEPLG